MLPDIPAISTLKSFGYPEKEAKQKAKLACNNLQNKCVRYLDERASRSAYEIVRWDRLQNNTDYVHGLEDLTDLYSTDSKFNDAIRNTTKNVILNNSTPLSMELAIDFGVQFILQELAFIVNAPVILGEQGTAYIYHLDMPVLVDLLDDKYTAKTDRTAGFILARA
jgi:tRNA-dependent cyclodipeptide synthase